MSQKSSDENHLWWLRREQSLSRKRKRRPFSDAFPAFGVEPMRRLGMPPGLLPRCCKVPARVPCQLTRADAEPPAAVHTTSIFGPPPVLSLRKPQSSPD